MVHAIRSRGAGSASAGGVTGLPCQSILSARRSGGLNNRRHACRAQLGSDGLLGQMVVGDEIAEFRGVAVETEHHVVDGAVALLCHDDLGLAVGFLAKLFPAVVAVAEFLDALV